MKCLSIPAFLFISLLLPSICHSTSIPPLEEAVSDCIKYFNSHKDSKGNFKFLSSDELFLKHTICSQSAIYNKLNSQERKLLKSTSVMSQEAKKKLQLELIQKIEQLATHFNSKWKQGYKEPYTTQEINDIDTLLRDKWNLLNSYLRQGDEAKALELMHPLARKDYAIMFQALRNQMPQIVSTEKDFRQIVIKDNRAKYELITKEDAGIYSYDVIFIKDHDETWYIYSF